jgi:hypothetical protein
MTAENVAPNLVTQREPEDDSGTGTGDLMSSLQRVTKSLGVFTVCSCIKNKIYQNLQSLYCQKSSTYSFILIPLFKNSVL